MWGFETQATGGVSAALVALTLASAATAAQPSATPGPQISTSASASEVTIGAPVTVTGAIELDGRGLAGAVLALQSDVYPFRGFTTVARQSTAADGSFSFTGLRPDRNTRLRVLAEAPSAMSRTLTVFVDPAVAIGARRLGRGATRMSLRIRHADVGGSQSASAFWFTAPRGTSLFRLAAVTPTRELAPGITYASVVVNPPARRFVYRVCLNPAWERAMGRAHTHGPCPRHDFKLPGHAG